MGRKILIALSWLFWSAFIVFHVFLWMALEPLAQEHPPLGEPDPYEGYTNPATGVNCCNRRHCRPVSCSQVIDLGGSYSYNGMTIDKQEVGHSPDQQCIACVAEYGTYFDPTPYLRCLLLPSPNIM